MIYEELIEDGARVRHYSDAYMIEQVETGHLYEDAVDYVPCRYTYRETEIPLPAPEIVETLDESGSAIEPKFEKLEGTT